MPFENREGLGPQQVGGNTSNGANEERLVGKVVGEMTLDPPPIDTLPALAPSGPLQGCGSSLTSVGQRE